MVINDYCLFRAQCAMRSAGFSVRGAPSDAQRTPHSALSTEMVGTGGLEPPTSCVSGRRSNHLSYAPKLAPIGH